MLCCNNTVLLILNLGSLESSHLCSYDRLTVYDGLWGGETWNRTGRYCRRSQAPVSTCQIEMHKYQK